MSRTFHNGERRIRVRVIRRQRLDTSKLAHALIGLVQAQAEAEAEAEVQRTKNRKPSRKSSGPRRRQPKRGGE